MKLIKFDLPIDGIKAKNIDELRTHFTVEILIHYRNGLLAKWLRSRDMNEELAALASIEGLDEYSMLKRLCEIFGVEADDLVIAALLDGLPEKTVDSMSGLVRTYDELTNAFDFAIYDALRTNAITAAGNGKLCWEPGKIFAKGDELLSTNNLLTFAPGVGKIKSKVSKNPNTHFEVGNIAGWFLLSKLAEDYADDWSGFRSMLEERIKLLKSMTDHIDNSLLNKSIENRLVLLSGLVDVVSKSIRSSTVLQSLQALPLEQQRLVFIEETS